MTIIWSGLTEEGAVVPVQVTTEGKVVATATPPGTYVETSGDTMTGELILPGTPESALGAVPKQYVDSALAPNSPIAYGYFYRSAYVINSFNVDAVRYLEAGLYQVYFRQIPPSANYVVLVTAQEIGIQGICVDRQVLSFNISLVNFQTDYRPASSDVSFAVYWAPDELKMSMSE